MIQIRRASLNDAESVGAIYKPYCTDSTISFEYQPPTVTEISKRIESVGSKYPWLIAECDGQVTGYAYATNHRQRDAYQWSVETSIYLDKDHQGKGIGKELYQKLFTILRQQGFINAYAGIGHPNETSIAFHRALGFEQIGVYKKVGYKFDSWWDVSWWHLILQESVPEKPVKPRSIEACLDCLSNFQGKI